jgi:hypothetical protein
VLVAAALVGCSPPRVSSHRAAVSACCDIPVTASEHSTAVPHHKSDTAQNVPPPAKSAPPPPPALAPVPSPPDRTTRDLNLMELPEALWLRANGSK